MIADLRDKAVELAHAAGAVLRDMVATEFAITHKGSVDLVTDADRASEACIIEGIRRAYPDHTIIAEESGGSAGGGDFRWMVDPLDGTGNFAHRIPHFSVLIAVQRRVASGFATEVGVVFDPMRDETFVGVRGGGATLNGQPIAVAPTARLADAVGATGFPSDRLLSSYDNHAEFRLIDKSTRGLRRLGSAGLDLAYVASGRFDFFWERGLKGWDLTAGALLVSEAGGRVSDFAGRAIDPAAGGAILGSNGVLHDAVVSALLTARPTNGA